MFEEGSEISYCKRMKLSDEGVMEKDKIGAPI